MRRVHRRTRLPRAASAVLAALVVLTLLAAACGGGGGEGDADDSKPSPGGENTDAAAEPTAGGALVYALEAETAGGFCLPEATLAIAGIQIALAIYDPLTMPDDKGGYAPYLAKSVTPNDDYTVWTIELREGVKFHDGTNLAAEVVKNNLDALRGAYEGRTPLLNRFTLDNIEKVEVSGPLTVTVTTITPWVAFPAYLHGGGRYGMMAQAQLDDQDHCHDRPIGTGPFRFEEWRVNDHLTVVRNDDYWQDGLPYLDSIEFRPMIEANQRLNALQGGEVNALQTSGAIVIKTLRELAASGDASIVESAEYTDLSYTLLNTSVPPFDNPIARRALALAIDRPEMNEIRNAGILEVASGPFSRGTMGYLDDAGYPQPDPDKAKELVQQYEEETGLDFSFTLASLPDPTVIETAQVWKEYAETVGIDVDLKPTEQAQMISDAIAGNFDALLWRMHPGGDPDTQYVWWHSTSPVNFGRFADPEVDRLLDKGRADTDPGARAHAYEDLNRRFSEQLYNLWSWWTLWAIGTAPDVHGIPGPKLPDGSDPSPGLAQGHSVAGIWIEQD